MPAVWPQSADALFNVLAFMTYHDPSALQLIAIAFVLLAFCRLTRQQFGSAELLDVDAEIYQ